MQIQDDNSEMIQPKIAEKEKIFDFSFLIFLLHKKRLILRLFEKVNANLN